MMSNAALAHSPNTPAPEATSIAASLEDAHLIAGCAERANVLGWASPRTLATLESLLAATRELLAGLDPALAALRERCEITVLRLELAVAGTRAQLGRS